MPPKAIAFEATIVGCNLSAAECAPSTFAARRRVLLGKAEQHRCPAGEPYLLVKGSGELVCVATLPSGGPSAIEVRAPSATRSRGEAATGEFEEGRAVAARDGCLACHRIGSNGNHGPGADLTHIGSRLSAAAIGRALVDSPAPMPSFGRLPLDQRRALVDFLAQLR